MGAKHGTKEHKATHEAHARIVNAGNGWCTEVVCLMPTRWIDPDTPWDSAHDDTDPLGERYLGPAHAKCNRSAGGKKGQANRNDAVIRWWRL